MLDEEEESQEGVRYSRKRRRRRGVRYNVRGRRRREGVRYSVGRRKRRKGMTILDKEGQGRVLRTGQGLGVGLLGCGCHRVSPPPPQAVKETLINF